MTRRIINQLWNDCCWWSKQEKRLLWELSLRHTQGGDLKGCVFYKFLLFKYIKIIQVHCCYPGAQVHSYSVEPVAWNVCLSVSVLCGSMVSWESHSLHATIAIHGAFLKIANDLQYSPMARTRTLLSSFGQRTHHVLPAHYCLCFFWTILTPIGSWQIHSAFLNFNMLSEA